MTEEFETTSVDETITKPRGRRPDPFVRVERARAKAERARKAYAKVQAIAEALTEAEAEEQAALQALAEACAAAGVSTDA